MSTRVGFIGWRGMVGSVLMERMRAENDFEGLDATFFTTSSVGATAPVQGAPPLQDARDLSALAALDILVSCQGGDYTAEIYPKLRAAGWQGVWIDAASTLRMADDAIIVLDPINRDIIERGLDSGIKTFAGGNCTVSLMMLALHGLFREGLIEWISSMTYQAASGAGAANMIELVKQMAAISTSAHDLLEQPALNALELDRHVIADVRGDSFPTQCFGAPLAVNLIPWIDKGLENGQTREEWKGMVETNKILGRSASPIAVDGECVRVGVMRCHSQGLTIKLTRDLPLPEIETLIATANPWVRLVPNDRAETLARLTPAAVSGTLDIAIGRLRKMQMGPQYLTAFTVGDQLLWGAAEPIRRTLAIALAHRGARKTALA
ncbi:MAG: aspartate-semialdehyde dehydrogenase [Proteobacteria bacterium]|nr:aspartate-semialdehyde dehydrogenase [Pseudomonadota bacterium]